MIHSIERGSTAGEKCEARAVGKPPARACGATQAGAQRAPTVLAGSSLPETERVQKQLDLVLTPAYTDLEHVQTGTPYDTVGEEDWLLADERRGRGLSCLGFRLRVPRSHRCGSIRDCGASFSAVCRTRRRLPGPFRFLAPHQAHGVLLALGSLECVLAAWVLCGIRAPEAALTQTLLLVSMNAAGLFWASRTIPDPAGMLLQNCVFLILAWIAAGEFRPHAARA
jgi:DoxX-like family